MQVQKILETSLYVTDLEEARAFYSGVLGLKFYSTKESRHVFFRCGSAMFLLFDPEETIEADQDVPSHGARGPGHVAFAISVKDYDKWKSLLDQKQVTIEKEISWSEDGKSI